VPYAYIARGKNMKQESPDELVCTEYHGLLTVPICIITPQERDSPKDYD